MGIKKKMRSSILTDLIVLLKGKQRFNTTITRKDWKPGMLYAASKNLSLKKLQQGFNKLLKKRGAHKIL